MSLPDDEPKLPCPECRTILKPGVPRCTGCDAENPIVHLPTLSDAFLQSYELLEVLGRGGMGIAFKARQRRLDRIVCIKLIQLMEAEAHERFLREGRCLAQIHHPRIITIFDLQIDRSVPYLVCEFVEGRPLRSFLEKGCCIEPQRAVDLTLQTLEGLAVAHSLGVIHRDVKPDNILVTQQWEAKLADFGLALSNRMDGWKTSSGMLLGTPCYMAPEQIEKGSIVPATDLYSTGVVLYEMLIGDPPFTGRNALEIMNRQLTAPVPKLGASRSDLPASAMLDDILARALAKNAADRYPDADAFWRDLKPVAERLGGVITRPVARPGRPGSSSSHPTIENRPSLALTERMAELVRRQPRYRALAALLVVLTLGLVTLLRQSVPPFAPPPVSASTAGTSRNAREAKALVVRVCEALRAHRLTAADGRPIDELIGRAYDLDARVDLRPVLVEFLAWSDSLESAGRLACARRVLGNARSWFELDPALLQAVRRIEEGMAKGAGRIVASLNPRQARRVVGETFSVDLNVDEPGRVSFYIIEPNGNVTRFYPKDVDAPPVAAETKLTLPTAVDEKIITGFDKPGPHAFYALLGERPMPQAGPPLKEVSMGADFRSAVAEFEKRITGLGSAVSFRHVIQIDVEPAAPGSPAGPSPAGRSAAPGPAPTPAAPLRPPSAKQQPPSPR